MTFRLAPLALALAASGATHAMTDAELAAVVDQRLQGDRTGACFAAAVVDGDRVARAWRCADASGDRPGDARIGADTAFEIGSVSKTMMAILLADFIVQGKASLDDPLASHLPQGTAVPEYEGRPILLRHLVTHTSGLPPLPPRMDITDLADPYAQLDADVLLGSLQDVTLAHAPGTRFEYSNFASMLLSWALAQRAGKDFESLAGERLFSPLGMRHAHIDRRPEGVRMAVGHQSNGQETPAWRFAADLGGVGAVRATLEDMVRYAQAQLGGGDASIAAAVELAQQPIETDAAQAMAMHWMLMPLEERIVHAHEGGTGGFSSYLAVDRGRERAVVVLSDTSMTVLGGLGSLGNHLLDDSVPLSKPRRTAQAPDELLDGLAGGYRLEGGPEMTVSRKGDALVVQAIGQPEIELAYDDAGDFYPQQLDALLSPRRRADGSYAFVWHQGGGMLMATRIAGDGQTAPDAEALHEYAGTYPLQPGFDLTVRARDGGLHAQATGQGEFALAHADADVFEAPAYGIVLRFQRGGDGAVTALELHQGGQMMRGDRRAPDTEAEARSAPVAGADAGAGGEYTGTYPLMPGFDLTVRERDGGLHAQATGQGEFALTPAGADVFEAAAHGIEIRFRRDGDGVVTALELRQHGQVMRGERR